MRTRHRSRSALLVGLAGFVAIQAGLALLLTDKLSWLRSPNYGHKVSRLHKVIETTEPAQTVVMLGSSRTAYGLKGSVIEPQLSRDQGKPVVVFNFGLHAAGPVNYLLNLRRLLDDGIKPDLLLIEVLPAVLSKQGPFNDTSEGSLPTASLRREELPLVRRYTDDRAVRQSDWWLGWCVPCYHHRFALVSHTCPTLLSLQERLDGLRDADASGWIPVHAVLRAPERRVAALAWAKRDYTARLTKFELGGPNVEALQETLRLCEREKIPTAIVLMPEGPEFRSWYPPGVMRAVNAFLAELSQRHHAPIINAREWIASEDQYLDSHHLLPSGAEAFSRKLGEEYLRLLLPPAPADKSRIIQIAEEGRD